VKKIFFSWIAISADNHGVKIERLQSNESPGPFALHFFVACRVAPLVRTPGERRSGGRFFQESWPLHLEGFPTSAHTSPSQEGHAVLADTRFSRINCYPSGSGSDSTCAARFSCAFGQSKRRYALWNSGARPEGHGYKPVSSRGKLRRRERFSARVCGERPVYRKDFPGAVILFNEDRIFAHRTLIFASVPRPW